MKKKLLLILAALLPLVASADRVEIEGIFYELSEDEAMVTWGNYSGDIVIPASVTYNGKTYNVTGIEEYVFTDCGVITSITIGNSVTSIGDWAFSGCIGLTTVTIGSGVTSIGEGAFGGCTSLTSIIIPENVEYIGGGVFLGCEKLTSITIPNSVTSIGIEAFNGCSSLTSVTIGSGVTSIEDYAFYGCCGLTSITIPENVEYIGEYAFLECYFMTEAFVNNSALTSEDYWGAIFFDFETSDGLLIDNEVVFKCRPWATSVTIPNNVTSIDDMAFYGCTSLTSVTIGSGVTSIGNEAFIACSSLTSITIPENVTSIGDGAFENCINLTSVTIGSGVTSIGSSAFRYCSSLANIIIPENVEYIGESAFAECYFMTDAFVNNSALTSEDYWGAFVYDFETSDGLLIRDNKVVVRCRAWVTSVTIPENIEYIGKRAFMECYDLTDITIPNSVISIGNSAFQSCWNLTSVTIGSGVTSIGSSAFYGCSHLTSINIPEGVTSIGSSAFNGCGSLTSITIPEGVTSISGWTFSGCSRLTSITIPDNVANIGDAAFSGCSILTSVTIGSGVTSIGSNAFSGCKKLEKICCYAVNVPQVDSDILGNGSYYNKVTLMVPAQSITQYKNHPIWKKFTTINGIMILTLDENSSNSFVAGTYETVTLKRTFKDGWNTLCLPFVIDNVEGLLGEGVKAYTLSDYADGELIFTRVTSLDAGKPYVVYVPTAISEDIVLTNVHIIGRIKNSWYNYEFEGGYSNVGFLGTYNPIAAGELNLSGIYGLTSNGYIMKAGAGASIKGFRAYFDIENDAWIKGFRFDDMEDAIVSPLGETEEGIIYNLAGQRQNKMQKGINIINGKKILK